MTDFVGTAGNDTANSALGDLSGFTGGTVAELTDGVGDRIFCLGGDDFVFAGSANDTIEGGDGFDLLNGAEGHDTIYANTQANKAGSLIGDELVGNLGNDSLYGSSGADSLFGSEGDDNITGGAGADAMFGGDGDDFFHFNFEADLAGETIDGGAGNDVMLINGAANFAAAASISSMEQIIFRAGASVTFSAPQIASGFGLLVNGQAPVIPGSPEKLRVEMGAATSFLHAFNLAHWGAEDLLEIVGDGSSETIGSASSVPVRLLGNGGNDTLTGDAGLDLLAGGTGNDVLNANRGNDTLSGGDGLDTVSWGWAPYAFAISFALPEGGEGAGPSTPLGQAYLISIENLTGGAGNDSLTGNSGANALEGGAGIDTLSGGNGLDELKGGSGWDTLTGGADADDFNYLSTAESGTSNATRDRIVDFVHLSDDIDVSAIDARAGATGNNTFIFRAQAAFTGEGQIRAFQAGANTIVEFNTAGASGAEMTIQLNTFTATTLTAADFIL